MGAVAIRARRAVDDGLAVGGDHVAALRVDGGRLAWHPEQSTSFNRAGCGNALISAWQSVQETSACTDILYGPGSTWSDMPGNFPKGLSGRFAPPA